MKLFVALLFVALSLFAVGQTWVFNPANGHRYSEIPLEMFSGWLQAESVSVLWGGHLVTINDTNENAWVKTTFGLHGGSDQWCWIGLYEIQPWVQTPRCWAWTSGETPTYTNWGFGEPSGYPEHFVAMDGDGWWRDLSEGNWSPPWYRQTAVVEIVPEPTTIAMFSFGLALLAKRRKRG